MEMGLLHPSPRPPFSIPRPEAPETLPEKPKTAEEDKPAPTPIHTDTLADIYIQQGHLQKALAVYEKILSQEPENVRVREKWEILQQRLKAEQQILSRQKIIRRLEKMLDVASTRPTTLSPKS